MSLVKGAEIPKANTKTADISKLMRDHENKQRQLRANIKVSFDIIFYLMNLT